jgi:zinc protease
VSPVAKKGAVKKSLASGGVLIVESSTLLPLVTVAVTFRSGAAHDPDGKEGLSRITTRMLRRGSQGLTAVETENAIDRLGAEISAEVATSTTAVYGQVLSRNTGAFLELLARVLSKPTFPEDEFSRLVRETKAEIIDARDNDRALADRFFRRTLFDGHAYGRTIRGTEASLATLTTAEARAHHLRHFVRGNAVVAFAGDITAEEAERQAEKLLSGLPDTPSPKDPLVEPKPLTGRHLVFVDKPERTQTQILIGALGTSAHDEDHVPLSVANAIFGGTFTSRLMKEVRSKRGWSYGASSRLGLDRHRHSFVLWTFPAATDAAPCIALELELLERLVESGVTSRELSFMKRYLSRSHAFEIDTAQKRVHQELDVELLALPADYHHAWLRKVDAVTVEEANAALKRRLAPANLLVTVVGTAKDLLPKVREAIPGLASERTVPYDAL